MLDLLVYAVVPGSSWSQCPITARPLRTRCRMECLGVCCNLHLVRNGVYHFLLPASLCDCIPVLNVLVSSVFTSRLGEWKWGGGHVT